MNHLNYFIKQWETEVIARSAIKPLVKSIISEIRRDNVKIKLKGLISEALEEIKSDKIDLVKKDMEDLDKAIHDGSKNCGCTVDFNDMGHYDINGWPNHKFSIRPMYNGIYDVLFFKDNTDREKKIGLKYEEVKKYVLDKLKSDMPNYTTTAYNKAASNSEDKDESATKFPKTKQNDIKVVKTEKTDDKNYKVDDVKNEDDLPDKPMREPEKVKKLSDHPLKGTKPDYTQPKLNKKESKLVIKPKSNVRTKKLSDK